MVQGFYKQLAAILRANGYEHWKTAKGSHEKWRNPATGRAVTVPRTTKSRHTANEVLKQAQIDERL